MFCFQVSVLFHATSVENPSPSRATCSSTSGHTKRKGRSVVMSASKTSCARDTWWVTSEVTSPKRVWSAALAVRRSPRRTIWCATWRNTEPLPSPRWITRASRNTKCSSSLSRCQPLPCPSLQLCHWVYRRLLLLSRCNSIYPTFWYLLFQDTLFQADKLLSSSWFQICITSHLSPRSRLQ